MPVDSDVRVWLTRGNLLAAQRLDRIDPWRISAVRQGKRQDPTLISLEHETRPPDPAASARFPAQPSGHDGPPKHRRTPVGRAVRQLLEVPRRRLANHLRHPGPTHRGPCAADRKPARRVSIAAGLRDTGCVRKCTTNPRDRRVAVWCRRGSSGAYSAPSRTAFRGDGGQRSELIADTGGGVLSDPHSTFLLA